MGMFGTLIGHTPQVTAQPATVRDSAGIKIISARARATAPVVFKLADKPTLSVGGLEDDPNVEFNHRQGYLRAARLATGGLAAIDEIRLHYFDASSKRLGIFGQKGSGPNEFQYLLGICATRGDTIVVSNSHNSRVTILDGKGKILRTIPEESYGTTRFDSCFSDGTFLLEKSLATAPTDRRKIRVTRMRVDGSVANVFGEFSTAPYDIITQQSVGFVASGEKLYYADAATNEIRIYDPTGKLREILRTGDALVPLSDAEAEARLEGSIPRNVSADVRKERLAMMRARPIPKNWPGYGRVLVDPTGQLWIQDYRSKYTLPDSWTAIDAKGTVIGRLTFPPSTREKPAPEIISFGKGDILLRTFDDEQASHLMVYPLVRIKP